jgi:hypothetical protein
MELTHYEAIYYHKIVRFLNYLVSGVPPQADQVSGIEGIEFGIGNAECGMWNMKRQYKTPSPYLATRNS